MTLISESNGLAEPPLTTRGQKQNIAAPPLSPDFLNRCPGEEEVENQQKHCFIHNEENEDHIRKDPEQFRVKEASLAMKPSLCKHGDGRQTGRCTLDPLLNVTWICWHLLSFCVWLFMNANVGNFLRFSRMCAEPKSPIKTCVHIQKRHLPEIVFLLFASTFLEC